MSKKRFTNADLPDDLFLWLPFGKKHGTLTSQEVITQKEAELVESTLLSPPERVTLWSFGMDSTDEINYLSNIKEKLIQERNGSPIYVVLGGPAKNPEGTKFGEGSHIHRTLDANANPSNPNVFLESIPNNIKTRRVEFAELGGVSASFLVSKIIHVDDSGFVNELNVEWWNQNKWVDSNKGKLQRRNVKLVRAVPSGNSLRVNSTVKYILKLASPYFCLVTRKN